MLETFQMLGRCRDPSGVFQPILAGRDRSDTRSLPDYRMAGGIFTFPAATSPRLSALMSICRARAARDLAWRSIPSAIMYAKYASIMLFGLEKAINVCEMDSGWRDSMAGDG